MNVVNRHLDEFVDLFHTDQDQMSGMLETVQDLYAKVWPVSLDDEDIKQFLSLLYLATSYFKPRLTLQTGTFVGSSSLAIGLAMKQNGLGRLYTIDPEPPEYFGVLNPVSIAKRVVRDGELEEQVCFLKGYSTIPLDATRIKLIKRPRWQLPKIARMASFDMLVIDGDHTFLGCYLDLVYGSNGLEKNGPQVIIIHDYLGIPEVRLAVDKWRAETSSIKMRVIPSSCGIALVQLQPARAYSKMEVNNDEFQHSSRVDGRSNANQGIL